MPGMDVGTDTGIGAAQRDEAAEPVGADAVDSVEIKADHLVLRPWRPDDADAVFQACQDPEIQRWTMVPRPYRRHHATDFVTKLSPQVWADGTAAPLGVFDVETGELLGANGLTWRRDANAEIGYWTAPWARGRGVATAATRAVAAWATEVLGIERLQWRAEVGNHTSRLVALRAGFTIEGVLHAAGGAPDRGLVDDWIGAIRPGEVTRATPEHLASGSMVARRSALFGAHQPTLPLDGLGGALRPIEADDRAAIVEMCADRIAVRWTALPVPYTTAHADTYIHDTATGGWLRGERPTFGIADSDGTLCGLIDLRLLGPDPDAAEISYLVAPWARGRGYATAAAR